MIQIKPRRTESHSVAPKSVAITNLNPNQWRGIPGSSYFDLFRP